VLTLKLRMLHSSPHVRVIAQRIAFHRSYRQIAKNRIRLSTLPRNRNFCRFLITSQLVPAPLATRSVIYVKDSLIKPMSVNAEAEHPYGIAPEPQTVVDIRTTATS
jgi:hypothetical protein